MSLTKIAIYGVGGSGRETAWLIESMNESEPRFHFLGFTDREQELKHEKVNGHPVFRLEELAANHPGIRVVTALGDPRFRELRMNQLLAMGFKPVSLIHPRVERSSLVKIGEGTVICVGSILTTNIQIGDYVQINIGCTLSHDVVVGDYSTLSPGVRVTGCVHIGKRVFIGAGAVIRNGTQMQPLTIGDDAVIGAGACVVSPVAAGTTVVGVPARPLIKPAALP